MSKEKLLYIVLGVLFFAYVAVTYYKPKPLNWTVTYSQTDKNPFGGYILYNRLDDLFPGKALTFETISEAENNNANGHLLIVTTYFNASDADLNSLFSMLDKGRSVMISAQSYPERLLDTLKVRMHFQLPNSSNDTSVVIDFEKRPFAYPADFVTSWFSRSLPDDWKVYATATSDEVPVLIKKDFKKGSLILCSTPLAFTNFGLLESENYHYASEALRLMSYEHINYTRFYHSGKVEPQTPLRYVLSQAPLKWAIYLTLLLLGIYLIIGSRRLQRMIPVLDRVENTTVLFIKTIGGLYHREGNHKNAANKLIRHFQKTLSEKYYIRTFDESTSKVIAFKSGIPIDQVTQTLDLIQSIRHARLVTAQQLKHLYDKLKLFQIH